MGCLRRLKPYESCIFKCIKWTIFVISLIGFVAQSYKCFEKYFSYPQAVEIALQPQTQVDFPSMTFCPNSPIVKIRDPEPYNWTKLQKCGINYTNMDTKFTGNSPDCQNPKNLWENATPNLEDFGINYLQISYFDGEKTIFEGVKNYSFWSRLLLQEYGGYFTLTLPKIVRQKAISRMKFDIRKEKSFVMWLHSAGLASKSLTRTLDQTAIKVEHQKSLVGLITYHQKQLLDISGEKCQNDPNYDYQQCQEEAIFKVRTLERL